MAEDQLICCDDCGMWAEFVNLGLNCTFEEASRDTFVFVCQKCNRLKDLEGLLAAADSSNGWVSVQKGRKPVEIVDWCPAVETSNSFSGLSMEDIVQEVVEESKERDFGISGGLWEGEKAKGKVLFLGDSITRYTDREFCKRDRRNRVRICLPGARIEDISARVGKIVGDEEVVAVQVGTSNLSRDNQISLRSKYKELICRLKSTRSKGVVCGILPRFDRKVSWGKILGFNKWLKNECALEGFLFVDTWAGFVNRRDLFAKDGLHLSSIGANELTIQT
ncbi:hypothetical protein HOLleu_29999 [Holothuria leucospilota]|uniref:OSK domain-containing protein n=1 Tax=Holothuria leucospilota TaxID=206669 RepID=A0A9Q1BJT3_HOLLE|nr:hypothetical protein HOLleu_29999 [Holothuria leucospilota]